MKAVILVGGEGTRLRPLTCNLSKTMVPVLNRPFLVYLFTYLKQHGVTDIILSAGYLPDAMRDYFGDGGRLGVRLTYLVESSPLGTSGAVKNAASLLDDTFLVFNGDILTAIDLTEMIALHRRVRPAATIALIPVENPTQYGLVETGPGDRVRRFVEKPEPDKITTNMINAGVYVLEPAVLDYLPDGPSSFERFLFPLLLEKGEPFLSYRSDAYWIDIGTPDKYRTVQADLLAGKAPLPSGYSIELAERNDMPRIAGRVLVGPDCDIDAGARITGTAVLGAHCRIGKNAVVSGAILWENVVVEAGAEISECVVASGCRIEAGSRVLENCVLGDGVTVGRGNFLKKIRVWPGCYLKPKD